MMSPPAQIIVVLFLLCQGSHCIVANSHKLISDLYEHFHSDCVVIFIFSEALSVRRAAVHLAKLLAEKEVPTLTFDTVVNENPALVYGGRRPLNIISSSHDRSMEILRQLFSSLQPSAGHWLLLNEFATSSEELLGDINIPVNCEFLLATESREGYLLTEAYRPHYSLPLVTSPWGSWSRADGLLPPSLSLVRRRNNLKGVDISAAAINDPPAQNVEVDADGNLSVQGFPADVMRELSRLLDFSLKIHRSEDNRYGDKFPNGSWDGVIGMILDGKTNISLNFFIINSARFEDVGYTIPVTTTGVAVFIRTSYGSANSWGTYFSQFSVPVWLCIVLCMAVTACCLAVALRLIGDEHSGSVMDSILTAWTIFCLQGVSVSCKPLSVRSLVWVAHLTAVVIMTAYSARIISSLAVRKPVLPFKDFQGLLDASSYQFGMMKGNAALQEFRESKGVMRLIYNHKLKSKLHSLPSTNEEGFRRVCTEDYAYLCESTLADPDKLGCDISMLSMGFSTTPLAFVLPKKSPYARIINYTLGRLILSGIVRKLYIQWVPAQYPRESPPFNSVGVRDVLALILIWLGGVAIATFLLIAEIIVSRGRKYNLTPCLIKQDRRYSGNEVPSVDT